MVKNYTQSDFGNNINFVSGLSIAAMIMMLLLGVVWVLDDGVPVVIASLMVAGTSIILLAALYDFDQYKAAVAKFPKLSVISSVLMIAGSLGSVTLYLFRL